MPISDVSTWLRSASAAQRASTSASLRPAGRSSGSSLTDRLGHDPVDQLVERSDAERGEHLLDLVRRGPEVTVGEFPAHSASMTTPPGTRSRALTRARLPADERRLRDDGGHLAPAHVDDDGVAVGGVGRQERERDAVPERRREVAAGDLADGARRRATTGWPSRGGAALRRRGPGAGGRRPGRARPRGGPAPEVALVQAHHPAEPGLQRRDPRPELVAVQRQAGLEAQRVAGAEAGRA